MKYRAKKARQEHEDGEWAGITSDKEEEEDSGDDDVVMDSDEDDSEAEATSSGKTSQRKLITSLEDESKKVNGLSKKAALFFDQDIFKAIGADEDEMDEEEEESGEPAEVVKKVVKKVGKAPTNGKSDDEVDSDWEADVGDLAIQDHDNDKNGFEIVAREKGGDWDDDDDTPKQPSDSPLEN